MAQNWFCFGAQPISPLGQVPQTILGHFSQAMPHTPIFISTDLNGVKNGDVGPPAK
jgi:hypothetical protein